MFSDKILYYFFRIFQNFTYGKFRNFIREKKNIYEKKIFTSPAIKIQNAIPSNMLYSVNRQSGKVVRNGYNFIPEINSLVTYSTLNKIKEIELKQKIKTGKKVRVCFFLDNVAKFSGQIIYELMKANESIFEPFILLYDAYDCRFFDDIQYYEAYKKSAEDLKENGFDINLGYDNKGNYIPIETFRPDIIIFNSPALDYSSCFLTNEYLNINYLTCYLNYSLNTINSYNYHYNNRRIASCWKHFVETREDYMELLGHSKFFASNAVLVGYPKIDGFIKPIEKCKVPCKIDNGNPIVIYAPHRSIHEKWEPLNLATFHLYYDYFLQLLKKYPNINFVFKPHPFLQEAVISNKIMTKEEYQAYLMNWENSPNGIVINDSSYIDLFRRSDLLIQDSGSFIGEWLPTDKPCMYLVNPERNQKTYMDGFSFLGRKILDKYYLCRNLEDIEKYFAMIMLEAKDPLKDERIKLKDEVFINIGSAGQKIVDYLTEILTN